MLALFAQFQVGAARYVVPARRIVRILPHCGIRSIPGAPQSIVGALTRGTTLIPVVDLSLLALGRASVACLSTRILLVHPGVNAANARLLAVIVEGLTGMVHLDEENFHSSGMRAERAPYLGSVATQGEQLLQRIDLDKLLPPEVLSNLYDALEGAA